MDTENYREAEDVPSLQKSQLGQAAKEVQEEMISPLLTEKQKQEASIRMNGTPSRLADAFSAQLAKQITKNEDLVFAVICIKNALEMGCPQIALEHCNRALKR